MKGYKTIKGPTPSDIIDAAIKISFEATILTSAQAAADKVGDAAYLHAMYNTIDEVAAMEYAAEIGQPEDAFSSRRPGRRQQERIPRGRENRPQKAKPRGQRGHRR